MPWPCQPGSSTRAATVAMDRQEGCPGETGGVPQALIPGGLTWSSNPGLGASGAYFSVAITGRW